MAHDVFISHARKDKSIADATCAALEQAGIRCWIAPRDIEPGADWGASLMDGLKASKVLVLILSSSANESPHIRREVERAVHQGTTIVPFRIEDVLPEGALEYHLGTVHWLDAMTPPLEAHLQRLTDIISAILTRMASAAHPIVPEKTAPVPVPAPKVEALPPPVVVPAEPVRSPEPPLKTASPVRETEVPPPPVIQQVEPLSEPRRLLNMFIAPRKTFADLRRNPRWWPALVILLGVRLIWSVAFYVFLMNRGSASSPSLLWQLFGAVAVFLTPLVDVVFYAVTSGIWFLVCKNLAGGRNLDFSRTFAVALYSRYPWTLGLMLSTIALIGVIPFLPFGGAAAVPWLVREFGLANSSPIVLVASGLDVFNIWYLVLAGLGLSQVSEVKRSSATVMVVIVFLILALVRGLLLV